MSIFDYPRINFTGIITINPGTANNDDYSGAFVWPPTGDNLALIDSAQVTPRTFGMSDEQFLAWIQTAQKFKSTGDGSTREIIPAEWNYYGDMSTSVEATVVGVQTGPTTVYTTPLIGAPLSELVGQSIRLTGNVTDVNSEGSPPGTQFFLDPVSWKLGEFEISGAPSKASCQWIYFTRNVNLTADAGAGGYMYHTIEGGSVTIPGFDDPDLIGVVLRYYVFARHGSVSSNAGIEALYEAGKTNPAKLQITGTFAPLYRSEHIRSAPVGRLLTMAKPTIPAPPGSQNNGQNGVFALAPAVVMQRGERISVDFLGSFPEYFNPDIHGVCFGPDNNPKYDFGPVALEVRCGTDTAVVGPVGYADTRAGDARGWVFEFDISTNEHALELLTSPDASFHLRSKLYGDVLGEDDYYVVSNQVGIYAEQDGSGDEFVTQGLPREPATISVFHRGNELSVDQCPPIDVWGYRTIPLGFSGDRELITAKFKPGQPLKVSTHKPGNYLYTFTVEKPGDKTDEPPATYADYIAPPFMELANRPAISLRVLPNDDFSEYWTDGPDGPVGNAALTFDVVFQNSLRTYYMLYPAMNAFIDLSDERQVAAAAPAILERTSLDNWMSTGFMPITRDMSESRRMLLHAWCRKVMAEQKEPPT